MAYRASLYRTLRHRAWRLRSCAYACTGSHAVPVSCRWIVGQWRSQLQHPVVPRGVPWALCAARQAHAACSKACRPPGQVVRCGAGAGGAGGWHNGGWGDGMCVAGGEGGGAAGTAAYIEGSRWVAGCQANRVCEKREGRGASPDLRCPNHTGTGASFVDCSIRSLRWAALLTREPSSTCTGAQRGR